MKPSQTLERESLSEEEKRALVLMIKLIPQLPESLQSHNLEDNRLNLFRRIVKGLGEKLINRS